jgi:hypothetical protein
MELRNEADDDWVSMILQVSGKHFNLVVLSWRYVARWT